jgi:hypothetical protein
MRHCIIDSNGLFIYYINKITVLTGRIGAHLEEIHSLTFIFNDRKLG